MFCALRWPETGTRANHIRIIQVCEPRIDGPRTGDQQDFFALYFRGPAHTLNDRLAATVSPGLGWARRCAAAFGL